MSTYRDYEEKLIQSCVDAVFSKRAAANQKEANVFRLASMIIGARFPAESEALLQLSEDYFLLHPQDKVELPDVVTNGWVASLPRLREMIFSKIMEEK